MSSWAFPGKLKVHWEILVRSWEALCRGFSRPQCAVALYSHWNLLNRSRSEVAILYCHLCPNKLTLMLLLLSCYTVRTELSFWPSCLLQMSEPIWCMDTVNCQDGMIMWGKVGWEWGKDCHVVLLHIIMNCVHSSEFEITNCQSLWQFLFYSDITISENCMHVTYLDDSTMRKWRVEGVSGTVQKERDS